MMPTGYTAGVADGSVTTLRQYALDCARGMGALVPMRDAPSEAPIPQRFEPRTKYVDECLARDRAAFAALNELDEAGREAACAEYNRKVQVDREEAVARNTETRNRYDAMIAKVVKWDGAPEGLKEFMLEQLHKARDFDCGYDPTEYMPKPLSVNDWFREELERLSRSIGRNEEERAKEVSRTAQRNAWLERLHAALASTKIEEKT